MQYLGIDISKAKFDVALTIQSGSSTKFKNKVFANNDSGFNALLSWLSSHASEPIHAAMESTGIYGEALAEFLFGHDVTVSVVNPYRIKRHSPSLGIRTKNDHVDARVIADYCAKNNPRAWTPPPPQVKHLKALVGRLNDLEMALQQEKNRLESSTAEPVVVKSINSSISFLESQIDELVKMIRDHVDRHPDLKADQDLLTSIQGVGEKTAQAIMALLPPVSNFAKAKQVGAYAGLTPAEYKSGTSISRKPRLCKIGNANLRRALFMPTLAAIRYNPIIRSFYLKLRAAGKPGKCAVAACMRKLLHIIFGVLRTQQPFAAQAT